MTMTSFLKAMRNGILTATLLGSVASLSAAGLIGHPHALATYNYTDYYSGNFDSSGGYTVFVNMPVKANFLDIGFDYTEYDQDSAVPGLPDRSRNQALLIGTLYGTDHGHKPYMRIGLGTAEWNYRDEDVRNGFAYFAEIAVEFANTEWFYATPYISWVDTFKTETRGDIHYGLRGNFALQNNLSVIVGLSTDEHKNVTGSIGGAFHF